ncbi:hypothetical protein CIB48_g7283 [Xylaria polymorpha]|nr:hypothetical protein CIB48_g7283 [Xylaria polymorpha]
MALDANNGFGGAGSLHHELDGDSLPIFDIEPVQLQFSIAADFVAAQVANNVLVLALSNGRILRIDLNKPEDIDDIDLPKRVSEVGVISRMFLDPTASHLLICTSLGENYYLHTQSRQPRPLSRLRGVPIESIAWNPSLPTSTTREILIGASDGNIYETFIEPSAEFYRKEEKYLKALHKLPDGPVTGLWVDNMGGKADIRRIAISTQSRLFHLVGRVGRSGHEGSGSIYTKLFDTEQPVIHEISRGSAAAPSALAISPDPPDSASYEDTVPDRAFAWLSAQGIYHGKLLTSSGSNDLGNKVYAEAKMLPRSQILSADASGRRKSSSEFIDAAVLTQWHIISLVGGRIIAANRLTGSIVYDQIILEPGQKALGLYIDQQKNTFWLFTSQDIFEIVVRDEDRDIWQIMLQRQQFDTALQYAHTLAQKDAVATASGDYLAEKGLFIEAAGIYGKSSKPFEDVALSFIDHGQTDALRKYLLTKLTMYKKSQVMQRMMIATWLVEVFMAKLNSLEDTIAVEAEAAGDGHTAQSQQQLDAVREEFHSFVEKHKSDLDRRTIYDVISSHAREEELLFFANAINDYNYELSYWVQRERWTDALNVLKKQTDPDVFYRYSSVFMTHTSNELVEILMRHAKLEPRKIIPAMLDYNRNFSGTLAQNQALRYLQYVINQLQSADAAVHNTLVSIYASHESKSESGLLAYLESQGDEPNFDPDFALRLCIQHKRTLSCVHIYTNMGQYVQAVDLALSHNEVEYASIIADRPTSNPPLRKKLWLAVARKVISQSNGIKTAIEFLKRCDLLKIEDLIPFFPDFVVIDDFKEEICTALEDYSHNIDALKKEMDESSQTAANIKVDIAALDHRYAIVEPGEKCYVCSLPLLSRQFFVFPCQHAFHSDCLGRKVLEQAGVSKSRRIKECQVSISKGLVSGAQKDAMVAELDALVASACILCSEYAIKRIDEPFIGPDDDVHERPVMTALLLPVPSTTANRSTACTAIVKWLVTLLVIWAVAGSLWLTGYPSPLVVPPVPENNAIDAPVLDSVAGVPSSLLTEDLGGLESLVPVAKPAAVKKHTDRVAAIIEDRPLGNLIPVILHFHSVLGPEWPVILYTTPQTSAFLLHSAPFSRAVVTSEIEIRHLPRATTFDSHASVSGFLTAPFLWTDLAPYAKVLLFQADSILCAGAPAHVDGFLEYDLLGAPIDARFGAGFNGGLSLRNRELVLRVIERWDFAADSAAPDAPPEWKFEDQWLFARMKELGEQGELADELGVKVNLPDRDTAAGFAVETIWTEGQMPLGFHQPRRWQSEHMADIMEYCPEVGMIAGSSFFG